MSKAHPPEMKKLMDKQICLKLNGSRAVRGMLRGFDPFMNVVLENTQEVLPHGQGEKYIGMVVVRGNSIILVEVMDRAM